MFQLKGIKLMLYSMLLLVLPGMSCLADQAGKATETPLATLAAESEKEQTSKQSTPQFKFRRSGPVCMCSEGMSEADIQAAKKKQASQ
jgi:hypothetical protein